MHEDQSTAVSEGSPNNQCHIVIAFFLLPSSSREITLFFLGAYFFSGIESAVLTSALWDGGEKRLLENHGSPPAVSC